MIDEPQPPRQRRPRARRAITPTAAQLAGAPEFAPVPSRKQRCDGWTYDRQRAFVAALAATGTVTRAAHAIGMTPESAYQLRRRPGAEGFARAWADALAIGVERLTDIAMERAIHGVPVPVYYKGEQVGEKRWYNDRLLMWTLRHHDPDRYGRPDNRTPPHLRPGGTGAAAPPLSPEQAEARRDQGIAEIFRLYGIKLREEARHREEGDMKAADFVLRQITAIELTVLAPELKPILLRLLTEHCWRPCVPMGEWDGAADALAAEVRKLRTTAWEGIDATNAARAAAARDPAQAAPADEEPPVAPALRGPTRAEISAKVHAHDARERFRRESEIGSSADFVSTERDMQRHWETMVDAGKIGKGKGEE